MHLSLFHDVGSLVKAVDAGGQLVTSDTSGTVELSSVNTGKSLSGKLVLTLQAELGADQSATVSNIQVLHRLGQDRFTPFRSLEGEMQAVPGSPRAMASFDVPLDGFRDVQVTADVLVTTADGNDQAVLGATWVLSRNS